MVENALLAKKYLNTKLKVMHLHKYQDKKHLYNQPAKSPVIGQLC
jgi:hypothetical protein